MNKNIVFFFLKRVSNNKKAAPNPYIGFRGSKINAVLFSKKPLVTLHQIVSTITPANEPI